MRNTWWITRPKRQLTTVPLCLISLANAAEGKVWASQKKEIELQYEEALEIAELKAKGERRDQGGGGARTYRAWMKSLGLLFMDSADRMQLTCAGEALVKGDPPLPILKEQVLKYQFPSAFSLKGPSAVDQRFKIRPFIFLLQLLTDERLEGYLNEGEDISKIVLCYATSNSRTCVDDVVMRILEHREEGDAVLEDDYVSEFASTRSKEGDWNKLFNNLKDIANTAANWLGYTQLITVTKGRWEINHGAEDEVTHIINTYTSKELISDPDDEAKFQRRYGLKPGQRKDNRNLGEGRSVTSDAVLQRQIQLAFLAESSKRVITIINQEVITAVAEKTGAEEEKVAKQLVKDYPTGSVGTFMHEYSQMALDSRKRATEFEMATTSIFLDVFGFKAEHIGQRGRVPDVVLASEQEHYGAILDSKAYAKGYSAGIVHQNRMRDYIRDFRDYSLTSDELAFFAYVAASFKDTINGQLQEIYQENNVPGAAITAGDLIQMVSRHQRKPYSHKEIKAILSSNRGVTYKDLALGS